jgi:hypothetical protein
VITRRARVLYWFLLAAWGSAGAQFWSSIGPACGFYKDFAFQGDVVIAGSDDSGGLWRTADGGETWQFLSAGFPDMTGWVVEVSPWNPSIVFACDAYGRWGLLRSDDGGLSWTQRTGGLSGMSEMRVSGIAICSADAESLLISTGMDQGGDPGRPGNGVFRSGDGGLTWTPAGLQGMTVPCICRASNGKIFAGTHGNGFWKMGTGGGGWSRLAEVPADAVVWQLDSYESVIAAATLGCGIYLSTDTGASFTGHLPGQYVFDVDVAGSSPVEVYASLVIELLKYSSQSGTWASVLSPPLSDSILVMGLEAAGDTIWCSQFANSRPVVSHDGGQSWWYTGSAPASSYLTAIAADPSDASRILVSSLGSYSDVWNLAGLFESTDLGATWQRTGPAAHGLTVDFRPPDGEAVYFGTFADGLFRSVDGGSTWSCIRPGRKVVFDVAIDPDAPLVMLESELDLDASTLGLYRSTDGGDSFAPVLAALVSCSAFQPGGQLAYAGASTGVYRSLDDGASWSSWRLSGVSIRSICLHGGDVYAGGEAGGLYRLTASVTQDITGPWSLPLNLDGILFDGGTLYAGLSGAELDSTFAQHGSIWMSEDLGQTWTEITGNLRTSHIYGTSPLADVGGRLHACTYGGGLVRLDDPSSAHGGELPETPGISMRTVACPSQGTAVLLVVSSSDIEAEVHLFDISGRLEASLGPFPLDCGTTPVEFADLAAGVHLALLSSDGVSITAMVVVLP